MLKYSALDMKESVFTRMLKGEVACAKIYEDGLTFAFLDKHPLTRGHALVAPKDQIDHLDDCPEHIYQAVWATVHKVSKHLRETLNPVRIGVVIHGLEIPHAHVHIVPLYTGEELHLADRSKKLMTTGEIQALSKELSF